MVLALDLRCSMRWAKLVAKSGTHLQPDEEEEEIKQGRARGGRNRAAKAAAILDRERRRGIAG